MESKKACWFVGVIVMFLLPMVEAVDSTTTSMPMPTTTSVVPPSTSVEAVDSTTTSMPMPTTTSVVPPSTSVPIVDPPPTSTSTPSPTTTYMVVQSTSAVTTPPSPTTKPTTIRPVSDTTMKLTLEIKFDGNYFDNAINGTTTDGKNLRIELCAVIKKNKSGRVLLCIIIEVRIVNSVVVKYELVVNATSREQAQEVVTAIENQVKTGKIGNYTVDPEHPVGAKITMQVDGIPVTAVPKTILDSTTLIVLLGVGLFLLVLVIILLVFLIVKLRKG